MRYHSRYYIILLLVIGLCSCNSIDEDNRFLDYELPPIGEKTVLLEEFTGWMCSNCPAGSAKANELQVNYNHKVIVVAIHAGALSRNSPLNSLAGQVYWNEFYSNGDNLGYPAMMFDRTLLDNGRLLSTGYLKEWAEVVRERIQLPAIVKMELKIDYDSERRALKVTTQLRANDNLENVSILYMLVESKIIGLQQNGAVVDREYEHNHVLRGVIGEENGNYWGEVLTIPFLQDTNHTSNEYILNDKWIPQNMSVVAVLYHTQNKQIIHAEEITLI